MSDLKQALKEYNVIPDVFPDSVDPKYTLTVEWPKTALQTPGAELDRDATQDEPKVFLTSESTENLENLVLFMVDPDLLQKNDTSFGQVRHWLVSNISSTSNRLMIPQQAQQTSPYIGPAPLPNYISPRPHRYIFIVAQSSGHVDISAEDLRQLQKPYAAAVAGKQEVQDLKDRWGFNVATLIQKKELKVIAVNFMRVQGNLNSTAANAMMQGEAVLNKVLGK